MKNIMLILLVSVLLCGALVYCGPDTGEKDKGKSSVNTEEIQEESNTVESEITSRPTDIHVVIDKSGSMEGYFKNQVQIQEGIEAIRSIAPGNKGDIRFFGDNKIFQGRSSDNIQAQTKFDTDTDMDNLISDCIKLSGDTSIVAFVTDGIVSTKQGKSAIPEMESTLRASFETIKDSLGWVVFRGLSPFDGTYYIESNRPTSYPKVNLKIDERPFYIIVIGPKPQLRYILKTAADPKDEWGEKWGAEWLAFNTHDDHSTLKFYPNDEEFFKEYGSGYKFHNKNQNAKIPLRFKFPECLKDQVVQLKPSNAKLELNGNKISGWKANYIREDNYNVIEVEIPGDQLYVNCGGNNNNLTLSFSTLPEKIWDDYNTEDDTNILNDPSVQNQTYMLKSLLSPMRKASTNSDVTVSFEFTD